MPRTWRVLDRRTVGSLSDYIDSGGGAAIDSALQTSSAEIIELLRSSGLRGRGGAGFPTGMKWQAVAEMEPSGDAATVVVNAAEGEPGTFKDRALLRTNPYRVLEGAIVAALTMQTTKVRIGIKASFGREIQRLRRAISEMWEAGWLQDLDVDLVLGPSSYLFGEETGLLEVVEGRQPFPRVTPPYRRGLQEDDTRSVVGVELATGEGTSGPPALVNNVETLANVALILERGPGWFRELGTEESPGTIVCTVSGATQRSGVGEVPMGSTLREVIDLIGWGPNPGSDIRVVLAGTANALIPAELLDTPLTYEAMRDVGSGVGSAGFIVFDEHTDPVAIAAGVARFLAVESCGQCERCKADGLFIAEQLRSSLRDDARHVDLDKLRDRIDTVTIGARCNLAQQQATVAASLLDLFPDSVTEPRGPLSESVEPVGIAPIAELIGGRAVLDASQFTKQPDWSYDHIDSGTAPAARLGDTPVHIADSSGLRQWPEWSPSMTTDHPLELVDDAHADIEALIDAAVAVAHDGHDGHTRGAVVTESPTGQVTPTGQDAHDGHELVEDRVDDVVLAVRTHIDVTQRVLYPMLRRVGNDEGERLADAAEAQERTLSRIVDGIDRSDPERGLQEIGAEMHAHADLEDEILEVLRDHLDPFERASLADGLAAARATSTVGLLRRTASKLDRPTIRRSATPQATGPQATGAGAAPEPAASGVTAAATSTVASPRRASTALTSLLVGVDGSAPAAAALGWAGRLAARVGAEVVVANVFEAGQAEVSPDDYEALMADARAQLDGEWSAPLDGVGVRHRSLQLLGAPDSLLTAAASEHADLLVVGTRGAGRFAGLHLGSLAHHLAHHTTGPLAIVPIAGANEVIDRIVVGVDGSPGSVSAVTWCADVAAAANAEVIAVCAVDAEGGRTRDGQRFRQIAEAAISNEWVEPLRLAEVTVHTRIVEHDHTVAALADAATDERAGLLVVGTKGLNEFMDFRLGHVPLQLVHHTHLPVVLVPPAG